MLTSGNRLTLLENGAQYFPALIAAIRNARRDVYLESYIFTLDDTGWQVLAALRQAVARGVRVRLLLDGFGSRAFPSDLARKLQAEGLQLMFFRPEVSLFRMRRYRLRRLHRKLVVVDGRLGFVGGINIIDDHNAPWHPSHRYDYAVRVEGPVVAAMQSAMRRLWWIVRWSRLGRRPKLGRELRVLPTKPGRQDAVFLVRDNLGHRRDIEEAYMEAIQQARREILIANAYFLPGWRFRHALVEAAARGVRVILVLQGRTDHRFYQMASRALYRHFLENGIEIYEYHSSELHAKVAVVDETWSTVGSSNIDPFSLLLSREANLVVKDAAFCAQLRASIWRAIEGGAHPLHRQYWRHISWMQRFASWLVYGLARFAMGMVGYVDRRGAIRDGPS